MIDLFGVGAAISLLDGVYLPQHISGVSFKVIAYGLPRVCVTFRQSTLLSRLTLFFPLGWE